MKFDSKHNPKAKLTPDQIYLIRQALSKGIPGKDLSIEYGVSESAISRIKRNKTWKGEQK